MSSSEQDVYDEVKPNCAETAISPKSHTVSLLVYNLHLTPFS